MSGILVGKVMKKHIPDHGLKFLCVALAQCCQKENPECFPGIEYLAWLMDYDESTVKRKLAEAKRLGYVAKVVSDGGRGNKAVFRLNLDQMPEKKGRNLPPIPEEKGRNSHQERGATRAEKGRKTHQRNKEEPALTGIKATGKTKGNTESLLKSETQNVDKGVREISESTEKVRTTPVIVVDATEKKKIVGELFEHYRRKIPSRLYTLTPARRNQALARLDELLKVFRDKPEPLRLATAQLRHAIDALANSDWHIQNRHTEWERVFGTQEHLENWISRWEPQMSKEAGEPKPEVVIAAPPRPSPKSLPEGFVIVQWPENLPRRIGNFGANDGAEFLRLFWMVIHAIDVANKRGDVARVEGRLEELRKANVVVSISKPMAQRSA